MTYVTLKIWERPEYEATKHNRPSYYLLCSTCVLIFISAWNLCQITPSLVGRKNTCKLQGVINFKSVGTLVIVKISTKYYSRRMVQLKSP